MAQGDDTRLQSERRELEEALDGIAFDIAFLAEHGREDKEAKVNSLFCPRVVVPDGASWQQRWRSVLPDEENWARSVSPWVDDLAVPSKYIGSPWWDYVTERPKDGGFPAAGLLRKLGIRSIIALPIIEGERIVASIVVGSKEVAAFGKQANDRLKRSRLDEVGRNFLAARRARRLVLIEEIQQYFDTHVAPEELAKQLVERMGEELDWEFVALWRVDTDFILISKCDRSEQQVFKIEQHTQKLSVGMLGETLNAKAPLWCDLYEEDGREKEPPPHGYERLKDLPARSTLFYPVKVQGEIEWILECASTADGAFSGSDREVLDDIIKKVQSSLDLWVGHQLLVSVIDGITDCILVVGRDGNIQRFNQAANSAFAVVSGAALSGLAFDDPSRLQVDPVRELDRQTVRMRTPSGRPRPMLATIRSSGTSALSRWVVHLSDADDKRVFAGLHYAKATVEEVTALARGPLMLARALLSDASWAISRGEPGETVKADLERAIKSLSSVDISYERLARALNGKEQTSLRTLLDRLRERLSNERFRAVEVVPAVADAALRGDLESATAALLTIVLATEGLERPRIVSTVFANYVEVEFEGVDMRQMGDAARDPLRVVETVARSIASGTRITGSYAAALSEGWEIPASGDALRVRIPRWLAAVDPDD